MIWEWLMNRVADMIVWLSAQITAMIPPVPSWVASLPGYIQTLAGYLGTVSHWLPVEMLIVVIVALSATWGAGLAIKGIRIVASFLTLGGGGAG